MSILSLQNMLWFLGVALEVLALAYIVRTKLRLSFPVFFTYLICQTLTDATLLSIYLQHSSYQTYFYAYWSLTAVCTLVSFFVLYEVFTYTLRPYTGLRDLATVVFRWMALLLLLVSALVTFTGNASGIDVWTSLLFNLNRSILLLQVGLLVFLFLCSSHLGLEWKNFSFGIALGLGFTAATNLIVASLRSQLGREWGNPLNLFSTAICDLAPLLWLIYACLPQPAQERIELSYRPAFDRWNQAALALSGGANTAQPGDAVAYLSDLERTVEQVLNQRKPEQI